MLFREIVLSAVGRGAIVLGGGPSAPEDYARVRDEFQDAVLLSANAHGSRIAPCHYVVAIDEIRDQIRAAGIEAPIIAHHHWADYRIVEHPHLPYSGILAAWVAWNLGTAPILLCGMSCYQGSTYFHEPDAKSSGFNRDLDGHLREWQRLRAALPPDAPVRAVSGPVASVFPGYRPGENFAGYRLPDRHALIAANEGRLVRITRPARVGTEHFEPRQVVELSRLDAADLIRRGRAVPIR